MGYSRNAMTALQYRTQLDEMVSGEGRIEIAWTTDNPNRLARQLREAIVAAAANAEQFPDLFAKYSKLLQLYKLCVVKEGVIAKPRTAFISSMVKKALRMSYEDVFTTRQLITATIKDKMVDEYLCRNFLRDDEQEMEDLKKWTDATNGEFEFIDHGESLGITLIRRKNVASNQA